MTVLSNILHAPVPDITQIRSDVPPALADLLRRMLTKDRDERIASMRLVAAELEAIRAGRSVQRVEVRAPTEISGDVHQPLALTPLQSGSAPQRELEQSIRFCRSADGVRLAYATIGDGPPLVKAANWLSHLEFDWQSPIWRHWLIGLAQQHTLIRYDERGCGLSDWNVDDFSFEAWVRDLEAVVDAAGVERFPLIGISQGGPIAIAYATRHPERVSHLILYGAYARGKLKRNLSAAQIEEAETLIKSDPARLGTRESGLSAGVCVDVHPRWHAGAVSLVQRSAARFGLAGECGPHRGGLQHRSMCATLPRSSSCLRWCCTRAAICAFRSKKAGLLASLIPGARLVTLDSNNHILLEHEPAWQKFLSEVHEFLATPDRSDPEPRAGTPDRFFTPRSRRQIDRGRATACRLN